MVLLRGGEEKEKKGKGRKELCVLKESVPTN